MKKSKRQFILDTLLPFKEDRSKCASVDGQCLYLTEDGRKCALGVHMKEGPWQHIQAGVASLTHEFGFSFEKMLTPEALEQGLTKVEWAVIQEYHDFLASRDWTEHGTNGLVVSLEIHTGLEFPELRFK